MTELRLLAVDASTPRTAVAVGRVDLTAGLAERLGGFDDFDGATQTSAWLVDRIVEVLRGAAIAPADLDAIACGVGPGTFTGTRVAIATCKGLALGARAALYPLDTLAAIAASQPAPGRILAVIDARRGEHYAAEFAAEPAPGRPGGRSLVRLSGPRVAPQGDLIALAAGALLVGTGLDRRATDPHVRALDGVGVNGLWDAALAALAGPSIAARDLDALYLRGSYAELGVNQPKRPFVRSPFLD